MQIIRAFHIIHANGTVYEFFNEDENRGSIYILKCNDSDDLGLQIPVVMRHCGLTHGIRNNFNVGEITDDKGRKIELWAIYADAQNNTRNKSSSANTYGRWVKPDVLASHATDEASHLINAYQSVGFWTNEDVIKYLLRSGAA